MHAHYVTVIITIAILVVGARLFLFAPKSEALSSDVGLDVQQMHKDKNVQKMSLVFDRNN